MPSWQPLLPAHRCPEAKHVTSRAETDDPVFVNQPADIVGGEHLERQPCQITVWGQQQEFTNAERGQERIEECLSFSKVPTPSQTPTA